MTTPEFYGVTTLEVEVYYSDRGLVASKRSLGFRDLKNDSFRCIHPICSGSDIRWRSPLYDCVARMKKAREKVGSYVCACKATNTDDGVRSCGAFYEMVVTIDYPEEKKPESETTTKESPKKNG